MNHQWIPGLISTEQLSLDIDSFISDFAKYVLKITQTD